MSADSKWRIRATDETGAATRSASANFQKVDKAVGALRGGLASLGAALGVGALAVFAKSILDNAGELDDLSKAVGISAGKLSELQYAAKMGGVELEGMGKALRFMERSISTSDKIFEQLGMSVEDLQGMAPDQAFLKIADEIANLKSEYDRTEASMKVFGKSGSELLPVIEGGSEAIRKMGEHARETGAALRDDQVAALAAAGDQIDATTAQLRGLFTGIMADLGPAFAWLVKNLSIGISDLIYDFRDLYREAVKLKRGLSEQLTKLPFGDSWKKTYSDTVEWADQELARMDALLAGGKEAARARFAAMQLPEFSAERRRTGELKDTEDAARAAKKAEQELEAMRREAKQITDQVATAEEKYNDELNRAGELLDKKLITLPEYQRYVKLLDEQLAEATKTVKAYNTEFSLIGSAEKTGGKRKGAAPKQEMDDWGHFFATIQLAAAEAAEQMDEAFTDALFDMKNGLAILKDFATDVFRQIANALIGSYITGPLLQSLGLQLPQQRAAGGPVLAGHPYIVGERRPEIFVPETSGTIIPNAAAVGAGGNSYHFNIQAIDTQSGLAFLAQNARGLVAILDRELGRRY